MSNTTTAVSTPTVTELEAQYEALDARAAMLGKTLKSLAPLNERSQVAQESFLLALADLKLLQKLLEPASKSFNDLSILNTTKEEIEAAGGLFEAIAVLAKKILGAMVEQLGVSEDAIKAAVVKDFIRVLELIDTILTRAEAEAATAGQ